MYNLDAYIADFLLENKKLSAQGLGEFTILDGQAENGAPNVQFVHNKATYTSEELVSFIADQQGKNKVVTGFDVESHLNQVKQFMNIGTPWTITGLGQLQLGKNHEFEFIQQIPNEHALQERNRRKQASTDANYQTYDVSNPVTAKTSNTGTVLLTLFIILALGAGGYYFYANRNNTTTNTMAKDASVAVADTVVPVPTTAAKDTAATTQMPANNSVATPAQLINSSAAATANPSGFRFILNHTSNVTYALKRYNQLKNFGTKVYIDSSRRDNSSEYKIYLIKNASPSDTARLRDSLTRYYGKPVEIEQGQ